jgi:CheY-like chemotaxis protein
MMPRLDGFGLLKALRNDEKNATVPVILLSARAGEASRVEGIGAGADDYLIKPFSARELAPRIETHLKLAQVRTEAEQRSRRLAESLDMEVRVRTRELEQRNADVIRQSEILRDLSHRMMQMQDDERRHIARELHDSAGQTLAVLAMRLAQLVQQAQSSAPQFVKDTQETADLVQQLNREIRTTSYLLHPPLLDETGLAPALKWYLDGLNSRSTVSITLEAADDFGRLPATWNSFCSAWCRNASRTFTVTPPARPPPSPWLATKAEFRSRFVILEPASLPRNWPNFNLRAPVSEFAECANESVSSKAK